MGVIIVDSKEILESIVHDFSMKKLIKFFTRKNENFIPLNQEFPEYETDIFINPLFLGEINYSNYEKLIIFTFKLRNDFSLVNRPGKKAQYELGKQILKKTNADAGIYIFCDSEGNFRFSLIYPEYIANKRKWNYYKRFTYYVLKKQTNKTFLKQIGEADFSSIEKVKEAFSVEPVTKEFYTELQDWYFWAFDKVWFPEDVKYAEDPEKNRETRIATNLIRLLTRLIFIWFMKEKELIPDTLFNKDKLKNIVKDFHKGPDSRNYYNAILQNLFFATLNRPLNEREFAYNRSFHENKKHFGVKSLYRYEDKFIISEKQILELFKDVPFLNGGLFDCLDEDKIYVDGFTRNKKKQAVIPDYLFFQEEEVKVDLSKYGLGSNKPVRGLIEILKGYNFTIDENTTIDQEIALDPELLGKVFENLLASYNPETATTARKATGSYYTPREIVNYMVEESIIAYLKTKLDNKISEDDIRQLVSFTEEVPDLGDVIIWEIMKAINEVKVIDPACGSGAFPMGVLHKLVYIMQKIDQHNSKWKELQLEKAVEQTEEVFKITNKKEREEILKDINDTFDNNVNYPDYARKLYLIENCIYGVDIQPIAVQISKLRFFISLLLDQKVDKTKPNSGIKPLPNLETKFVAADTLMKLEKPDGLFYTAEIKQIEDKIKQLRHRYFQAKTRSEKMKLKEKDLKLRKRLMEVLEQNGWSHKSSVKIARFDIFSHNKVADWFDPELMLGVIDGFDIVISNPPYIQLQANGGKLADKYKKSGYLTFDRMGDIYTLFYERGIDLLKHYGYLTYITSNKWMRAGYGKKIRKIFLKYNPRVLIDLGANVFENATVDTNILLIEKTLNKNELKAVTLKKNDKIDIVEQLEQNGVNLAKLTEEPWFIGTNDERELKEKIERIGKLLKDWNVNIHYGIKTGLNKAFIITTQKREEILANCKDESEIIRTKKFIKPILRGRDIKRYYYDWSGLWVIVIPAGWTNRNRGKKPAEKYMEQLFPSLMNYLNQYKNKAKKRTDQGDYWWELRHCSYYSEFEKEKVVWQELAQGNQFAYDNNKYLISNTGYILTGSHILSLTGILNSSFIKFIFEKWYCTKIGNRGSRWLHQHVIKIPIPLYQYNEKIYKEIEKNVNKIIKMKQQFLSKRIVSLERRIDELVFKLYNLNYDEVKIICPDFWLTKEKYEKI